MDVFELYRDVCCAEDPWTEENLPRRKNTEWAHKGRLESHEIRCSAVMGVPIRCSVGKMYSIYLRMAGQDED